MPVTEALGVRVLTKKMMAMPEKRKSYKTDVSAASGANSDKEYIAGETIVYGQLVCFDADGKIYVSRSIADGELAAPAGFALAVGAAVADSTIKTRRAGEITISGAEFTVGAAVWLGSGTINATTDLPSFAQGSIVQELGIALTATKILIKIQEPEYVV
jgi:hypothetical protein